MPLVPFQRLMADAEAGSYAVGYFESWNLESLLAVADAAEETRSPVILGFSGIYLTHPERVVNDSLSVYAAMGLDICRKLSVPTCLLYNESPNFEAVLSAIDLGFNTVMYSDEELGFDSLQDRVIQVREKAHRSGSAVEAETASLQGLSGHVIEHRDDLRLTDPDRAQHFVAATGIDALAVNIGQLHLHGREKVLLDLDLLSRLKRELSVPLVLHGASSVESGSLAESIRRGIRKINVGSMLKQIYFEAMRAACLRAAPDANPYEIIGSGMNTDVLVAGRQALKNAVADWMRLFGSAGRAA
jgi:fructose/tagatose bisphosphate aldolase